MTLLHNLIKAMTVALFAAIIAIVSVQIIARYVFASPFVWAEELMRYMFVWTVMFAGALGLRAKAHLALDMINEKNFHGYSRLALIAVSHLAVVAFLLVLIYFGAKLSLHNFKVVSPAMQIPIGWPYLGLPIGGIVMLTFEIEAFNRDIMDALNAGS